MKKEEWTPTSRKYLQDCLRLDMTSPEKTDDEEEGKRVRLPFSLESSRLCKSKESLDRIYRDNVLTTPAARRQLAFVSDGPEDTRTHLLRTVLPGLYPGSMPQCEVRIWFLKCIISSLVIVIAQTN